MTTSLIDTLNGLRTDPTLVVQLYRQIFEASFYALVRSGTEQTVDKMKFLTNDTQNNVRELPLFTSEKFILNNLSQEALTIQVGGQLFWTRLIDILETGKCEVAINPGQTHGIRLTKEWYWG